LKPPHRFDANGWCVRARHVHSPNQDERPDGTPLELIVVHSITLPPGEFGGDSILRLFTNTLDAAEHPFFEEIKDLRVSAHFLVRRDGELIQFVAVPRRAWHAGVSSFEGRPRCNDYSVGIEMEGTDDVPFTDVQYQVLVDLCRHLTEQFSLVAIAAHSEIAPGRKTDPGPMFDWLRITSEIPQLRRMKDLPAA
jgi:AmpD protein